MAPYDPYSVTAQHTFHSWRRFLKKLSLVLLILGIMGPLLGVVVLGYAWLGPVVARRSMLYMAGALAGGGLLVLLVRWPIETYRDRTFHRRRPRKQTGRDGMVLLLVLLLLAAASLLVLEGQLAARHALRREQERLLDRRLETAAAETARFALQRLADDPDPAVDHTNETWAAPIQLSDPTGVDLLAWVEDESQRFDGNNLSSGSSSPAAADIFMNLLTLSGDFEPVGKADALRDWIDDNQAGAWENAHYRALDPPYDAADRRLYTWSDLLQVSGFSRAYFAPPTRSSSREPFRADRAAILTVLPMIRGSPIPINVNTAPADVLHGVLGLGQDDLARLILVRRDRAPIRSLAPLLAGAPPALRDRVAPFLDVRSRAFRVHALARSGGREVRIEALARREEDGRLIVEQWVTGRFSG